MPYNRSMSTEKEQRNPVAVARWYVEARLRNTVTRLSNALVSTLPGERPDWVVLELRGSFPARRAVLPRFSVDALLAQERTPSQEEIVALVTALAEAPWLKGVVIRLSELHINWAAAYALRKQLLRLRAAGKRVLVTATELSDVDYYLASAADEIILPESAELAVRGFALQKTYKGDLLERFGVKLEKLAIREYKSALDDLARSEMSAGDREQLEALLDSYQQTFVRDVAVARKREEQDVKGWVDEAVSSATEAVTEGMIDGLAYEDELLQKKHKPLAVGARFLTRPLVATSPGRVALVSLEGSIVTGRSRRSPVPIPLVGGTMAGSETLVRALRTAGKDTRTKAVVFHVDSGGGSALASDLIWREVKLLAERMPVVAVMGSVAGSGGYYVLTHATKVMAAPMTITGSIGIVSGKLVVEEFNAKYGLRPEVVKRGRFADSGSSARGYDDEEREWMMRYMNEVYDRFVGRVADGRGLSVERVNEIGRGRIYSGEDALKLGLIDEFGDVGDAVTLAKELAGLNANAPVWTVKAPPRYVLPVGKDTGSVMRAVAPLLKERALLLTPFFLS